MTLSARGARVRNLPRGTFDRASSARLAPCFGLVPPIPKMFRLAVRFPAIAKRGGCPRLVPPPALADGRAPPLYHGGATESRSTHPGHG
jgi:hypothetical protein